MINAQFPAKTKFYLNHADIKSYTGAEVAVNRGQWLGLCC
jgi:hypothetical protein